MSDEQQPYDPFMWHWIVADTRPGEVWSSADGGYIPAGAAQEGRVTRIASEAELSDVLRPYGLQGPYVSADDVRAEAQRRIIAAVGARDINGCYTKQLNALMRATELTNKRALGEALSSAETAEAAALQAVADKVKAIRAASNVLEPAPPADFAADSHWPA